MAIDLLAPHTLVLIEPNPTAAEYLRHDFAGDDRVVIEECAVGATPGHARLHQMNSSVFDSLLSPLAALQRLYPGVERAGEDDPDVRVETLDNLLATYEAVDVLKIDVQGAEAHVLTGATETLRRTDAVVIEANLVHHYEGDSLFWDLAPSLFDHGFELYDLTGLCRQSTTGRALWADAVFVRRTLIEA
jgi:FkbM family methyltransferase